MSMPFEELFPFLKFDNTKSEKSMDMDPDAFIKLCLSLRSKVKKLMPALEKQYVESLKAINNPQIPVNELSYHNSDNRKK